MIRKILGFVAIAAAFAAPASAQLDPLLFVKSTSPYVLIAVDTSNRMQRDAPGDTTTLATSKATSSYYDPFVYTSNAAAWEIRSASRRGRPTAASTTASRMPATMRRPRRSHRREQQYQCRHGSGAEPARAGDLQPLRSADADGGARARSSAILQNLSDVQFGLLRMRQNAAAPATQGNTTPITSASAAQSTTTENTPATTWKLSRPMVATANGAANSNTALLVDPTDSQSDQQIQEIVGLDARNLQKGSDLSGYTPPGPLLPAGVEASAATVDAPLKYLLDDVRSEADTLIKNDDACTNTIVVLITGGGEGTTAAGVTSGDPGATALTFRDIRGRRVPIYVIAIAPPASDVAGLKLIATNSGGQYFEITKSMVDAVLASPKVTATPRGARSRRRRRSTARCSCLSSSPPSTWRFSMVSRTRTT